MPRIRRATHSGTWYSSSCDDLQSQISQWLSEAKTGVKGLLRGVIAPHAGLSYCGRIMAHAFKHIDKTTTKRIFLLGPSHKLWTRSCMLTQQDIYATPSGAVHIDRLVCDTLHATGLFELMDKAVDENEHSLELLLPFIMCTMQGQAFTLVPIMVGDMSGSRAEEYGVVLAPYMADTSNLFVISSDFCHWGQRFGFTLTDPSRGHIWQSIEWLDRLGMDAIESLDPDAFSAYQALYRNTICGQYPIALFLHVIKASKLDVLLKFNSYDQSFKCMVDTDSSVSYAAAVLVDSTSPFGPLP